ncbi:MAG: hypothetical protein ABSD74_07580 [Rhizomicrobium sp.]
MTDAPKANTHSNDQTKIVPPAPATTTKPAAVTTQPTPVTAPASKS